MLTYASAEDKINNLKNLDLALYGDTKGEIRQVIINKLETHLFHLKDTNCPEEYLAKLEEKGNPSGKDGNFFNKIRCS